MDGYDTDEDKQINYSRMKTWQKIICKSRPQMATDTVMTYNEYFVKFHQNSLKKKPTSKQFGFFCMKSYFASLGLSLCV